MCSGPSPLPTSQSPTTLQTGEWPRMPRVHAAPAARSQPTAGWRAERYKCLQWASPLHALYSETKSSDHNLSSHILARKVASKRDNPPLRSSTKLRTPFLPLHARIAGRSTFRRGPPICRMQTCPCWYLSWAPSTRTSPTSCSPVPGPRAPASPPGSAHPCEHDTGRASLPPPPCAYEYSI